MAIKSFTRSTIENNIFYRSMLAGNTAYDPSSENILAETILTSSQASVTFSGLDSLAAGYQHLQIRFVTRTDRANTSDPLEVQFNGDGGNNYQSHILYSESTSVTSANTIAGGPYDAMTLAYVAGGSSTANVFSGGYIDLLDPFETTKYTTARCLYGQSSLSLVGLHSGGWRNTAALTSITIYPGIGTVLVSGSRFSLIGLK